MQLDENKLAGVLNSPFRAKHFSSQMLNGKKQRGVSLIGTAFVLGLVLFSLIVAMKIVPAYVEHNAIKKILRTMVADNKTSSMTKREVVESFNRRKNIDNIESVSGQDLTISTDDAGNLEITVQYQVVRPVMANLSALIDFEATSARK